MSAMSAGKINSITVIMKCDINGAALGSPLFMDFSLLIRLEFFVFRKMESESTINHPLCGCATEVIQKLPFLLQ